MIIVELVLGQTAAQPSRLRFICNTPSPYQETSVLLPPIEATAHNGRLARVLIR